MIVTLRRRYRVDPPVPDQDSIEAELTRRLMEKSGIVGATVSADLLDDALAGIVVDAVVEVDSLQTAATFARTAIRSALRHLGVSAEHLTLVEAAVTSA